MLRIFLSKGLKLFVPFFSRTLSSIHTIKYPKCISHNHRSSSIKVAYSITIQNKQHPTQQNQSNPSLNNSTSRPKQIHKDMGSQGYGYYNWNNEQTLAKAVQDQYFLDDLIIGFRKLKAKDIQLQPHHLTYMAYTMILFPQCIPEIMEEFKPAFVRLQAQPGSLTRHQEYIRLIKLLCFNSKKKQQLGYVDNKHYPFFGPYLRKRIMCLDNRSSLQAIYWNISNNCYQYMGDLQEIFQDFKKYSYQQLEVHGYKIEDKTIRLITSTYQKLILFDPKLKQHKYFSTLPSSYTQNQQHFQNLLLLLPHIISFNFIAFASNEDLLGLNKRIAAECGKWTAKETRMLLRNYSEHLACVNRVELICFQGLLDSI